MKYCAFNLWTTIEILNLNLCMIHYQIGDVLSASSIPVPEPIQITEILQRLRLHAFVICFCTRIECCHLGTGGKHRAVIAIHGDLLLNAQRMILFALIIPRRAQHVPEALGRLARHARLVDARHAVINRQALPVIFRPRLICHALRLRSLGVVVVELAVVLGEPLRQDLLLALYVQVAQLELL
jgi:hypothetical protein